MFNCDQIYNLMEFLIKYFKIVCSVLICIIIILGYIYFIKEQPVHMDNHTINTTK